MCSLFLNPMKFGITLCNDQEQVITGNLYSTPRQSGKKKNNSCVQDLVVHTKNELLNSFSY